MLLTCNEEFSNYGIICYADYTLIMKSRETTTNYEQMKSIRVFVMYFTEHLFHILCFTSFRSRWRFFKNEMSKVFYRVLCKSALIHAIESKFHENDKKCVKECFTFHILLHVTPWNAIRNRKYGKRVASLRPATLLSWITVKWPRNMKKLTV